ncbi:MAG: type II toxin-antitoxin system RelE/ParE family toxin [Dehalococcoidales bacterium]|nr:type II toxin-antitoxin system RelE/ParE family toxin [Dehalococcoidales bacterium]
MSYQVHILRSAEKEMERLPATVQARLSQRILSLEENPRPRGVKKLSGREEYRLRVSNYRILYVVDDANRTVTIVAIGHRREVYG